MKDESKMINYQVKSLKSFTSALGVITVSNDTDRQQAVEQMIMVVSSNPKVKEKYETMPKIDTDFLDEKDVKALMNNPEGQVEEEEDSNEVLYIVGISIVAAAAIGISYYFKNRN